MTQETSQSSDRRRLLQAELDRLRGVFAGQASIRQVIVFGSFASGRIHAWSDLDLVVIEESEAPFVERGLRLARLARPRVGTQFLVYTPREIRDLASRPFVRVEILEKGKVLSMSVGEEARRWLDFAAEDLEMANLAIGAGIHNQACFHAEQCVEMCLMGCWAAGGGLTPRTHLIADLLSELPVAARRAMEPLASDLEALDQFYIPTRYPDALPGSLPEGLPVREHALEALETARRCHALSRLFIVADL